MWSAEQNAVGDPVLAAVAHQERRARRRAARRSGRRRRSSRLEPRRLGRSRPASQCAPRMSHGTTCSRRQNDGPALARGLLGAEAVVRARPRRRTRCRLSHDRLLAGHGAELRISRARGRRDRAGAARAVAAGARPRGDRRSTLELEHYDLSLENRRATGNEVVDRGRGRRCARRGFGLKAATITPEGADDVGSPNRILREEIDGKVIVRTGRRIPGVTPVAGVHHPISVVPDGGRRRLRRRAVARGRGRRRGRATAPRRSAAPSAGRSPSTRFRTAAAHRRRASTAGRSGRSSPVYEGMLKEEMDAAAERHPDVALRAGADRRDATPAWSAAPPTRRS